MPGLPTTPRGAATSRRILDAAAEEFAARGIAGARIDRIIAAARTNKAQLYGYFGSKDGLFDAVVADRADRLVDAIPFDATDLPGWAVAMYDETLRNPQLVRLMTWLRLERRPEGRLSDDSPRDALKLKIITEAQAAGRIRQCDPFDLFALVFNMALAWSAASGGHTATPGDPEADHERRRALLRESVQRVVAP
ncbi:AcrR family transcriptional regulator [Amycolatopsis bartoniae]|uniref:TetR family transcriptional regulator n=1 Tax=Amycolatopsis bartoniae TaxID=941986 RepID=A0A8H9IP95_9PSEU|nr:TetR family transcriptional regulator [Amycolatopsis bartoniae]MBB2937992.1 AcrR family transcriptional regulator [Amycolatopsis bartoniae]TVT07565.1 TetR/AcrR family transcriptional regulator [Amycolatopsis bartoniae]GHF42170.1 TetR family transcriptional regulator [Amycolatopsis bartoniae]